MDTSPSTAVMDLLSRKTPHCIRRVGEQAVIIYRTQLSDAKANLDGIRPGAADVHAARKDLKRARATLRLLHDCIDLNQNRREDMTLRTAAHLLNDVRDSAIQLRLFDLLRRSSERSKHSDDLHRLRQELAQEKRSYSRRAAAGAFAQVHSMLRQSHTHTYDWNVSNEWQLLVAGMRRTYRKGRAAFRETCASSTDSHLHAWRKQAKYSGYQLDIVSSLGWNGVGPTAKRFARLARLLGDDHDLAILQERIGNAELDDASNRHLMKKILGRREKLQRKALALGARLYQRKPYRYIEHLTGLSRTHHAAIIHC